MPKSSLSETVAALVERVLNPLGLVVLSRERIQETLSEAAQRGRLTRSDAQDLALELIRRGRLQTEELLTDVDQVVGRGRQQVDRALRTVGVGPAFPISGYDELTAEEIKRRLGGLNATELRMVRGYERRHANRKAVLRAIDHALG